MVRFAPPSLFVVFELRLYYRINFQILMLIRKVADDDVVLG